ncbi:hypothetical protein HDU76_009547, partial [Blyttiomyces sp. JEL0837]
MRLLKLRPILDQLNESIILISCEHPYDANGPKSLTLEWYNKGLTKYFRDPLQSTSSSTPQPTPTPPPSNQPSSGHIISPGPGELPSASASDREYMSVPTRRQSTTVAGTLPHYNYVDASAATLVGGVSTVVGNAGNGVATALAESRPSTPSGGTSGSIAGSKLSSLGGSGLIKLPTVLEDLFPESEIDVLLQWVKEILQPSKSTKSDNENGTVSDNGDDVESRTIKAYLGRREPVDVEWSLMLLGRGSEDIRDGDPSKVYFQVLGRIIISQQWLKTILPLGKVAEIMRTKNWAATPLGKIETWSPAFLSAISVTMNVSIPSVVSWGRDKSMIFNEAYAKTFSIRPDQLGQSADVIRKEFYTEEMKALLARAWKGETIQLPQFRQMIIQEDESLREKYFTTTIAPLRTEYGYIGGVKKFIIDVTKMRQFDRRLMLLKEMAEEFPSLTSLDEIHTAFPVSISTLKKSEDTSHFSNYFPFKKCWSSKSVLELKNLQPYQPLPIIDESKSPVREAIIMPIRLSSETTCEYVGLILLGLNPHIELDKEFREFAGSLSRELAHGVRIVRSFESERKRAEDLVKLDEQKTRFFTSISHEIRTPLSLIVGPLEDSITALTDVGPTINTLPELPCRQKDETTMSSKSEEEVMPNSNPNRHKVLRRLNLAKENAMKIKVLVDRLLDFHQLEAGKMIPRFARSNLTVLTKHVIELFRDSIVANHLICDTSAIEELDEPCVVDADMWEKILFNLISNAMKFTVRGSISFALRKGPNNTAIFEITDTGPGIPDDEKQLIFTRFYRCHQNPLHIEGTGIGLSLVQELIALHRGEITVSDAYPSAGTTSDMKGSRFTVTIPFNLTPEDGSELVDDPSLNAPMPVPKKRLEVPLFERERAPSISTSEGDSSRMSSTVDVHVKSRRRRRSSISMPGETYGMTLFVIDDNPEMRAYVQELLSELWTVYTFDCVESALEALKHSTVDLIICDVLLPKLSGFDLIKILREDETKKDIPVFLLTVKSAEESRISGLLAGADDYIIKPFSAKELLSRINTRLELQRLRKHLVEQVSVRTAQLHEEKRRFEHLARMSPVALLRLDRTGYPIYVSDKYWDFINEPKPPNGIKEEYHPVIIANMKSLLEEGKYVHHETGFKNGTTVVSDFIPDIDDNGEITGFIGCLTNITEMKKLEKERLQAMEKRADEAEEAKRQKEEFIDMICHEIRNPLSAILNNNDLILDYLKSAGRAAKNKNGMNAEITISDLTDLMESISDCAKSISVCAKHQKCIADDVLHMSKLSLELVKLNMTDFDPVQLADDVLGAMDADMKSKDIKSEIKILEGIDRYEIKRVISDPVRVTQV